MKDVLSASPTWRFAILSDTHLGAGDRGVHNHAVGPAMPRALRELGAELGRMGVRFVLHCGDVTDSGSPEQIRLAADLLAEYACPVYLALGNHDAVGEDRRGDWLAAFPNGFGGDACHYAFTCGGLRFVVLHPWWRDGAGVTRPWWDRGACAWSVPAEQLEWLDATLAAEPGTPTLIVHHAQIIPLSARRLPAGKDNHTPPPGSPEALLEVLAAHPQVFGVISGHTHAQQIEYAHGLVHIGQGAMVEYPYEYRVVTVIGDRMRVSATALFGLDGSIWSSTGEPWPAGQECDRITEIAIPRRQQAE